MHETNIPYFFKYYDEKTGQLKQDAPAKAKADFRKWKAEPTKKKEPNKGGRK